MNTTVLRCCDKKSDFRVTYAIGSTYLVCSTCIFLPHWARGVKTKEVLD